MTDELGVGARRRATRQLLIGVPLVIAWAIFAVYGPAWLVERGQRKANACIEHTVDAKSDPSGCGLGAGFAIARLFPAVRAHAATIELEVLQRRAERTFYYAMASKPTSATRDAAAAKLLADAPDRSRAIESAADAGAFATVAAADLGRSSIRSRLEPAFAAIAIGDIAAAKTAIGRGEPTGFDGPAASAALACLLGDRARGQALLRGGASRERHEGTPSTPLRFAAQHCGGTFENVGFDPYVVPSFHEIDALISRLYDPKIEVGRRATIGASLLQRTSIFRAGPTAALALVASGTQEPGAVELVKTIGSPYARDLRLGALFAATPWQVWSDRGNDAFIDYVPPTWLEVAADRYARAARLVPAKLPVDNDDLAEGVAAAPGKVLQGAAMLAYEFAAGYRLRRGDRAGASVALDKWRALAPADLRRASLELAVGAPAVALATLDMASESEQRGQIVGVTRVLALAALGELGKAHAIAKHVSGRAGAWLALATAIASGAPITGLVAKPEGKNESEASPERMLATIEAKQPVTDVGYLDEESLAVLPAVMVVVAHAAKLAGQDPEVVLDATFARRMPSRTIALARAEAARWRKDAAAAQLWQGRAEAIEKLFVDDHAVVLAGIAGLW